VTRGETGRSLDEAKFQFFQGEELIDSWDWKQEDRLEADFESLMPIQWVDNRTLHIGGANRKSEFSDEIIVLNNTGEYLKYVSVVYDKDDIYKVFGLAPGNLVTIRASPWFTAKGEEFTFGYTAETRSGKPFENIIKGRERTSANTGPLKFQITIDAN
jgi:hypothetical protein